MAAFLTDFILQFQARRAALESSRQRRWVPWPRFRGESPAALSNRLLRQTSTPTLLPSSSLDTSEYIEPRSFLAQVLSNIRSPELKLHNGMCSDYKAFQDHLRVCDVYSLDSLLGGPRRYQNGWMQRAPICATCLRIRTHSLCSYLLILLWVGRTEARVG